jgi:CheY-like chemotaxis protein
MFAQGSGPRQRPGEGLGIGLALARRIAELHGGTLTARSEGENRGSEFTLRMSLSEAPAAFDAAGPSADAAAASDSGVPRRVLVVDDNADAATTLDMLLRSLGHETAVAHGGVEALRMAAEFRPDLVLLDVGMPDLDGYEVARRLREIRDQPPFRIVAVTGWGQQPDRRKSHEAGFDVHLVKPVSMHALLEVLDDRDGAAPLD